MEKTTFFRQVCLEGNLENIKKSVRDGVCVKEKDEFGRTLFFWCCVYDQVNLCDYMLEQGADIEVRDEMGLTPLESVVLTEQNSMILYLLDKGADPSLIYEDIDLQLILLWCQSKKDMLTQPQKNWYKKMRLKNLFI